MNNLKKVIETDCYVDKCECGGINTKQRFLRKKEGQKSDDLDLYLAFCKCGNLFIMIPEYSKEKLSTPASGQVD